MILKNSWKNIEKCKSYDKFSEGRWCKNMNWDMARFVQYLIYWYKSNNACFIQKYWYLPNLLVKLGERAHVWAYFFWLYLSNF